MEAPASLLGPTQAMRTAELASATPAGCFVEVGVYKGGSAWHLAQVAIGQNRALHLFDTFTGIPFKGPSDQHEVGDFADVTLADVQRAIPSATFYVGIFPDTLPDDLDDIAFVHCDCDQLASVQNVVEELSSRMVLGGVMAFDDMNQGAARLWLQRTFGERLMENMGVWYVRFE